MNLNDYPLLAYLILFAIYKISENLVMARAGIRGQRIGGDWTMWLIMAPYYLILFSAPIEYYYLNTNPGLVNFIFGGLFFITATIIRVKAHLDLSTEFSMAIEKKKKFVTKGLYKHIRHPLYLANILLFIACPLFLNCAMTWIFALAGLAGILARIPIEEKVLASSSLEYKRYMQSSRRLLPWIY